MEYKGQALQCNTVGNNIAELQFDSKFEKENNDKWLKDASIITKYENKINTKY